MPRAKTEIGQMVSRKYAIGEAVFGVRSPSAYRGIFVRAYVTINNGFRNPAYVVKCDIDGKERVFQVLRSVAYVDTFSEYFTLK